MLASRVQGGPLLLCRQRFRDVPFCAIVVLPPFLISRTHEGSRRSRLGCVTTEHPVQSHVTGARSKSKRSMYKCARVYYWCIVCQ